MMKTKYYLLFALLALPLLAFTTVATGLTSMQNEDQSAGTLVKVVRQATEGFKNLDEAEAAGYGLFHGCVSGPEKGAMGIHLVKGDLVGDDVLDPLQPEALIYEVRKGQHRLVGVEYIVFADAWNASNEAPPILMGQVFNYVGSPNRYNIPAFYELHVWAWKRNPSGMFVDWNPNVSCADYAGEAATGSSH